jgi:nitroimidazol reductase NimA-like FMN-containing flavoprotein (pyridoxamine 5'-phosphate oxidase superfamily)
MDNFTPTSRTEVRRLPKRAVYDREQIYAILDEGYLCHAGFVVEGRPFVIPMGYGRDGDQVYLHGSAGNRVVRAAAQGLDLCITVTLVDGFVLARSAFHHSMNYRSVVMLGKGRMLTDTDEKRAALRSVTNHMLPGRWEEVRQPTEQELQSTGVVALKLDEVSAKVRTGPPLDDEADYSLPVWAGVIPIAANLGDPIPDGRLSPQAPAVDPRRFTRAKR